MENNNKRAFVTVEELSEGFSEYSLKEIKDFAKKKIELYYEAGYKVIYEFINETILNCTVISTTDEESIATKYNLYMLKNNVYYLNFIWSYGITKTITTIFDFNKNIATTSIGILPNSDEVKIPQFERGEKNLPLTSVKVEFEHASIGKEFTPDTLKHCYTEDLVGKRMQWIYSSNDVYEHIYLNSKFYTWQCLKGIEKGLCDTDRCYYYKIDDGLYWFTWAEKIVPTIGSVVEDFDSMRSYGMIYGYKDYSMTTIKNFPVGSYATLLNKTEYTFK